MIWVTKHMLTLRVLPVQDEYEEEGTRSPGKRPSVTLRIGSGMLMSPGSALTTAADSDGDEPLPRVQSPSLLQN